MGKKEILVLHIVQPLVSKGKMGAQRRGLLGVLGQNADALNPRLFAFLPPV